MPRKFRSKSKVSTSSRNTNEIEWETESEDEVEHTVNDILLIASGQKLDRCFEGFHLVEEDIVFERDSTANSVVQVGLSTFKLSNRLIFDIELFDRLELCRRCMQQHGHIFLVAQVHSCCDCSDSAPTRVTKIETWHCLNALFHDTGEIAYERVSENINKTNSNLEKVWGIAKCKKFSELHAMGGNDASLTLISIWLSNQYPGHPCILIDLVFDLIHFLIGNIEVDLERFCLLFRLLTALTISIMQQIHEMHDMDALSEGNYWKVTIRLLPQIVELFGRLMWLCSKPITTS